VIWLSEGEELTRPAVDLLKAANDAGQFTYISPISAWEIGQLVSRSRVQLLIAPHRWFARLFEAQGVHLAEMSPDILIASSFLPGKPPRDPADRIIAATARDLGATLITRDRALLGYGDQGHLSVAGC
jgi:PIN domain nuclease of toxin-antitoxin system